MSIPIETILGVVAASLIGVGSVVVVLDTTARHAAHDKENPQVECIQQGETLKCIPKIQPVTVVPGVTTPATSGSVMTTPPVAAERIEKVEETLDRIMMRLDRIEEKVEKKP